MATSYDFISHISQLAKISGSIGRGEDHMYVGGKALRKEFFQEDVARGWYYMIFQ